MQDWMHKKIGGNAIMKKNQVLWGLGTLALALAPAAHATLLSPPLVNLEPGQAYLPGLPPGTGNDSTSNGNNPIGTLVASTGIETVDAPGQGAAAITGSFISEVYEEAGGTLDFYYQVSVNAASTASLDDLSVSSFLASNVTTPNGVNVGQATSVALLGTGGVPGACGFGANPACTAVKLTGPNFGTSDPTFVSYTNMGTVDFNWDGTPLEAGQTSVVFVISTNNTLYTLDTLSLDGSSGTSEGNPSLFAFQPASSVPEPISIVLLGTTLALAALFIRRRRHVTKVSKAEIKS
jgi:hypothetical protein